MSRRPSSGTTASRCSPPAGGRSQRSKPTRITSCTSSTTSPAAVPREPDHHDRRRRRRGRRHAEPVAQPHQRDDLAARVDHALPGRARRGMRLPVLEDVVHALHGHPVAPCAEGHHQQLPPHHDPLRVACREMPIGRRAADLMGARRSARGTRGTVLSVQGSCREAAERRQNLPRPVNLIWVIPAKEDTSPEYPSWRSSSGSRRVRPSAPAPRWGSGTTPPSSPSAAMRS